MNSCPSQSLSPKVRAKKELLIKKAPIPKPIWDESINIFRGTTRICRKTRHTFWRFNGRTPAGDWPELTGEPSGLILRALSAFGSPSLERKVFAIFPIIAFHNFDIISRTLEYFKKKFDYFHPKYYNKSKIITGRGKSMFLSSSEKMKSADNTAIFGLGIDSLYLMENAATHIADKAHAYLGNGGAAVIFCGSGNNGGDGVAAARILMERGCKVRCLLTGSRDKLTADTAEMAKRLESIGGCLEDFNSEDKNIFSDAGVIIDAMFGIGLNKPLRGKALEAVKMINASGVPVVAADIPSGIEADTGRILGDAVKARETVTFSLGKPGHFVEPGNVYTGKLSIVDIGIPDNLVAEAKISVRAIMDGEVSLPKRNPLSHKGDHGKIMIIAGSGEYCGAPNMCSLAAVRSGAGLVYLGVPECIHTVCAIKNTEAMSFGLPCDSDGRLTAEAMPKIWDKLKNCSVCVIGPGMGRSEGTLAVVREIISSFEGAVVADADALWAIAQDKSILRAGPAKIVLTPHGGEAKMLGINWEEGRISAAKAFAEEYGCTLVLKGHRSLAAYPDGEVAIATHGNAGMAKGGSGDVLAGILGAMLGQFDHEKGVDTALHLHSLAGDIAREKYGEYAMLASDIIASLPEAEISIMEEKLSNW